MIGYRIDARDSVDDPWEQAANGLTGTSAGTVSGLENGVEYSFSVVALAADGTASDRSAVVTVTPGAARQPAMQAARAIVMQDRRRLPGPVIPPAAERSGAVQHHETRVVRG